MARSKKLSAAWEWVLPPVANSSASQPVQQRRLNEDDPYHRALQQQRKATRHVWWTVKNDELTRD